MISIIAYLMENKQVLEKIVVTKNYVVEDFKSPPKEFISKYRRKEIIDNEGERHLATFAILNKKGQEAEGRKTVLTSMWHPKSEPKAKILMKKIKREEEM